MAKRVSRLDAELVRRGLARSRQHAGELIAAGRVEVHGVVASKAATGVDANASLRLRPDDADPGYASRGGHKLAGALAAFPGISVAGKRCLDAGASTGGFTDVLLRAGAARVIAVDVGYGQLAWALRSDPRVEIHDRTNVRTLSAAQIGGPVDLTVADLSFISLPIVLPALTACTAPDGIILPMVKPQFEVGRERLGSGGVVRDPADRGAAVLRVARAAAELGWPARGVVRSPLPGPAGNVEFFLWLRRGEPAGMPDDEIMTAVITEGGDG
ncbi:MAG TPA: TlyA family RNA methyltransferase [Jatrophihabitans sp.]|nr:TlyA family RNA methyltransferase [Jatrophihabitans sp.]